MSDWYNAFIMTTFFNVTQPAKILLLDAHPSGPLDDAWTVIFKGLVASIQQILFCLRETSFFIFGI